MSVGATASLSRAFAADSNSARVSADDPTSIGGLDVVEPADGDAQPNALPDTLTDGQGRVFKLQVDPLTGHPQYRHAAEQRDPTGSTLSLEILISLAPDGSFSRRTTQQLNLANGDTQREVVLASHDAKGVQVGETVESASKEGSATTTEKTVGTYAAGKLVRRETDVEQADQATDPLTKEVTKISNKIHGTWDEGGREITSATVPKVDRNEEQRIETPGGGINKDTDRTIVFTRHGAGLVNAIDWDEAGKLIVRFEGHKGQYIEREMKVPLDQTTGAPDMANAETVRTDDKQNLVNKGLMQARVWGGLASNLSWIIGVNFAKGNLGKGFLALSAGSAGAQLVGETHAVATKRNDGDWSRVAVSAYDMLLTGMLAAYMSGRKGLDTQLSTGQRAGLTALGGAGIMANGSNLLGANPIGTNKLMGGVADSGIGAQLAALKPGSPLDSQWRLEPRFDAGRALLS